MAVLITGGAGYIGSHTLVELLQENYDVVVLDNFVNGSREAVRRAVTMIGGEVRLIEGDVRDRQLLNRLFADHSISTVIHLAGLKAVGESVRQPLDYYSVNVQGSLVLCQAMQDAGVRELVFSSSATVYGVEAPVPYRESMPRGLPSNPYGTTKAIVEHMLEDLCQADPSWSVVFLRYFNPIGAHPSGEIGEDPRGIPNNLMPFISQVAAGHLSELSIFGNDYPTEDGTCVRDYIHVVDLAIGHVSALKCLSSPGLYIYNLGTGRGVSVLEMVAAFESLTGKRVPYHFAARRSGDLAAFWADADKANRELGWRARRSLTDMLRDTWRWQQRHPAGYGAP
ncbi:MULTISPECIES: UDP-glucose 4-epimerase GalE [Halomonadaceae]|uniref:UDP-glucose 4-epimerase n=1 Tax=Billgrantia aerodenitrificans TaxID=2733483 RepID=A0ABS9AWL7_9GAMM|nr:MULTISPECIES: UDP-glucose 4-epimerase GalE [Halomonas]MCE8025883.1 UDP-glucose 4-epimerase GalE [Halomonas aerodenitrificans]